MDLLIKFEKEKQKILNSKNVEILELATFDSPGRSKLSFFCGMCHRECYEDTSSGISFFKKVYVPLNLITTPKYKKFIRKENGENWMKICFRCKYNNNLLFYCKKCDKLFLRNSNSLENQCKKNQIHFFECNDKNFLNNLNKESCNS